MDQIRAGKGERILDAQGAGQDSLHLNKYIAFVFSLGFVSAWDSDVKEAGKGEQEIIKKFFLHRELGVSKPVSQ